MVATELIMYGVLGGIMFFSLIIALVFIAGKDIWYAFYRKIVPKGADIFVLNYNKNIDQYYKIPKSDGSITIKGATYVVNPNKVLNLSTDLRIQIEKSLAKKEKRIAQRISYFENKLMAIQTMMADAMMNDADEMQINQFQQQEQIIQEKVDFFKEKMTDKSQIYYHRRRPMLLYIENDPVPKDLFEFYTEMDSIMIDNVIARTMTKDPKGVKDLEKFVKMMKLLLYITVGAAVIAALVGIYNQNAISQLADHIGVKITL